MTLWSRVMWRNELREAVKLVLERRDMTAAEISATLRKVFKIRVHYAALNSIMREMVGDGVYVRDLVYSPASRKMIILYTIGVVLEARR